MHQVENGGGVMPAFKDTLSAKQIQDVAAYVFASTHCLAAKTAPRNDETRPGEGRESPQVTSVAGQYQGEPARRILQDDGGPRHRPEG